jgi:hypothetical protein
MRLVAANLGKKGSVGIDAYDRQTDKGEGSLGAASGDRH